MKEITLNNGISIPPIGFGTYPQKDTLVQSAQTAYAVGYRLFDISDNYNNEEYLGKAIETSPQGMVDALVVSKFSQPYRTRELDMCFQESSAKLSGKVDIYLLHWPYPFLWKEQWRKMEALYKNGQCKGIGVCNFEIDRLKELLSICEIKPVINQIERHPLFQQQELVDYCTNNNLIVMSYAPVARHNKELFESDLLKELAEKYNKTIGQIVLRWNIDTGTIPIPGSKSEAHIIENFDVDDFSLANEEIQAINGLECGKRIRFDPKTRFKKTEKIRFALTKVGINI